MTSVSEILVFAGPNGSGKSTVTSVWKLKGIYINADDIKASRDCSDIEAAKEAEKLRELCLNESRSFTFETVLSTERNLDLLHRAKSAGYFIESVFVLTTDPKLNVFRVRSRVLGGGHDVPTEKIISRYEKSMLNIPKLLKISNIFTVVDNTKEPSVIYNKNANGETIHPNKYWTSEAIRNLIS